MVFILIPFVIILLSAAGIFAIIWRKLPYLRKLSVADVHSEPGILVDLFPEFTGHINSAWLKHYRAVWFIELEKFLRRLRVLSLKMDRTSTALIKKIRNVTAPTPKGVGVPTEASGKEKHEVKEQPATVDEMKKEEQRLIIEIAKNPKNSSLYEVLGDLYMKMSNFADAKESYEAAIELNPTKEELKKKHSQAVENVIK